MTATLAIVGGICAMYFEEVRRHAGVDAAHACDGFPATLTARCEHNAIPYSGAPVGPIKKQPDKAGWTRDQSAMVRAKADKVGNRAQANTLGNTEADALVLLGWTCAPGAPASRRIEPQRNDGRLTVRRAASNPAEGSP